MFKFLASIIYKFLNFFDKIFKILFKRSFLIWINNFLEKDAYRYISHTSLNKKIRLFNPNYLTNWLYDDFFLKEPETIEWIDNFNENKSKILFWDIGSNLGIYSIYAAMKHKNIEIISFEPSTNNLRILSRNIYINGLQDKIKIVQLPLSDKTLGFAELKEKKFGEGESNNTFDYNIDFEGKELKFENSYKFLGTSLNYLIENRILEIPNYIKIDVDGVEHKILKGFNKFLSNSKIKKLQIEINENFEEQKNEIFKLMKENKFIYKLKKRNENLIIYKAKKFERVFNYYFEKEK